LEELTGEKVPPHCYCHRYVADGLLTMSAKEDRIPTRFFLKGESVEMESRDFLKTLERGDVVIKGANAVDWEGNAGVLVGNETAAPSEPCWASPVCVASPSSSRWGWRSSSWDR
jgi:hypothetical protein